MRILTRDLNDDGGNYGSDDGGYDGGYGDGGDDGDVGLIPAWCWTAWCLRSRPLVEMSLHGLLAYHA